MVSNLRKNFLCIVWHQKPTVHTMHPNSSHYLIINYLNLWTIISGINWNNHHNNAIGGSSQYRPGGSSHYKPGGSSHYPGSSSQYRPGGSSQSREKRSPENAPNWSSSSAYKPNYNDQNLDWNNNYQNDELNWNQNNNFGGEICYSDAYCSGRQKCCNRKCTHPAYWILINKRMK